MTISDAMTQLDIMIHVQRTPTIPMTKRESVASNGTRVSLLNGSAATAKKWESKDFINTNPNMVAGQKRSPRATKKVKRTDSYKIALNRESVFHTNDDSAISNSSSPANGHPSGLSRSVPDRKKYNTLPRTVPSAESIIVDAKRTKHESDNSKRRPEFDRNASQRSGTCPSPDTDTDQQSVMTDRKKKSAFKRMKERLILTFKRDRDRESESERGSKKGKKNTRSSRSQIKPKPRTPANHGAFGTPSYTIETSEVGFIDNGYDKKHGDDEGTSSDKKGGFLRSIRHSMRRKSSQRSKGKSSSDNKWAVQQTSSSSQSQSSSSMERERKGGSQRLVPGHSNKTDTFRPTHNQRQPDIDEVEEAFADDSITGLFESLIDPNGPVGRSSRPRPDTSKFRLEGLRKCEPRRPGSPPPAPLRSSQRGASFRRAPSPDLEVDGVDEADGDIRDGQQFGLDERLEFADVSQTEKQRRIDDVAHRLAAIGDSIANRRESESALSSMEDTGQRSELERSLLRDLRQFGDDIDGTLFSSNTGIQFNVNVIPIICNIIRAQNYSRFTAVIEQELRDTVGWEQVAWYTYLMKSAMCIASTGKTVGSMVKGHATRYFNSTLQPWIRTRPKGWESINEETDVESELD